MNKAVFITVIVTYLFGAATYLVVFGVLKWKGFDWLIAAAPEALTRAAMWPYLIYEWFRFDMPMM